MSKPLRLRYDGPKIQVSSIFDFGIYDVGVTSPGAKKATMIYIFILILGRRQSFSVLADLVVTHGAKPSWQQQQRPHGVPDRVVADQLVCVGGNADSFISSTWQRQFPVCLQSVLCIILHPISLAFLRKMNNTTNRAVQNASRCHFLSVTAPWWSLFDCCVSHCYFWHRHTYCNFKNSADDETTTATHSKIEIKNKNTSDDELYFFSAASREIIAYKQSCKFL